MRRAVSLLITLLFMHVTVAWSNTYTHPWVCEQGIRGIWGNETFEAYSNSTDCSKYPDLGYPNETRFENYTQDTFNHHCYATCPVNSSWVDSQTNDTYCGIPSDCPAWTKAQEWFNLSKDTGDLYYKICYFCVGSHYLADAGDNTGRGGNPYHKMRYEDQSGCHAPLESKTETRMSNLTKWGNWSFTQECDDPPQNFTLMYQDMLDTIDMIVYEYLAGLTTTTSTTSTTTSTTSTSTTTTSTTLLSGIESRHITLDGGWNLISLPLY